MKTREDYDSKFVVDYKNMLEVARPELIECSTLLELEQYLIKHYPYIDPASADKEIAEKTLFLICSHPEYLFLKPKKYERSPFHCLPDKNIFNLFYFHEDTSDAARKMAAKVLLGNKKATDDVCLGHAKSFHLQKMILFYMEMMRHGHIPQEVLFTILCTLLASAHQDILISLKTNHELPSPYKNSHHTPTLYQQKPVSLKWLIERGKVGLENYQETMPSKKGQTRLHCISHILANYSLSSEFKIMALFAILNEFTLEESRIKTCITEALGRHIDAFNTAAKNYAVLKNIHLSTFTKKLTSNIHDEELIGKIYIFHTEKEDQLLERIGMPKTTSNTKKI